MTNAHRDLATPELWTRSLERSRHRRALMPKARRENRRRKNMSAALATAVVAGPGAPLAAAQVSGEMSAAVAAESPANRAIEIREGGLPLRVGSRGDLVAHVQTKLGVASDGVFGPQTDAAVRRYQLSARLEVDGIVGPNTWSALFEQATTSGASIGGSNVPPQVKQQVEQRLEQAGADLAVQGDTGAGTTVGGQVNATTPATGAPAPQQDATLPTTQAPAGGSCSSATIATPVKGTVTSEFGPRGGRNHDGIDIAAPSGTPIHAAACGTVSLAGQQSGYGNIVCVTHTSQFSTCYAHLSRFGVSNGARVQQGQVIGYVGCTGNCTGPHLHFETRVNGQATNPRPYLAGSSVPGARATVAGASSAGTKGSTTATATVQSAPAAATPTAAGDVQLTAEGMPATAEPVAVDGQVAAPAEPVAVDGQVAAPAEVAAEPVGVEVQAGAPAEVAPAAPVAVDGQVAAPAAPVAVDVAAPAEVAPAAPVSVDGQVAAPAEVATPVAPVSVDGQVAAPAEVAAPVAVEATAPADATASVAPTGDAGTDQAQVDAAATAAVQ
jgi:peptidoglycan hydrolase-like protein with peptidoglycan-binding domain